MSEKILDNTTLAAEQNVGAPAKFDDPTTESQHAFLAQLREMESPETWLLFVNAGFTMADALALRRRDLIETSTQMGMPAARLSTWVEHDGGPCPLDTEQRVMVRWRHDEETATHRAGVFNWGAVSAYRLIPLPKPLTDAIPSSATKI